MKTAEEYIQEAAAGEGIGLICQVVALRAVVAVMKDHEKFVDEQLEKVDKLGERIKVLNDTISAINGELKRHLGD